MSTINNYNRGGLQIGFCGLLTLVFITLKLLKIINWSWIWVLAPLWMSVALFILVVLIVMIIGMIVVSIEK